MNFNFENKIGARFKLVKRKVKPDGSTPIVEVRDWFNNLMLDRGLAALSSSTGNQISDLIIGTGNVQPSNSQTELQNKVASTTTSSPNQPANEYHLDSAPYYVEIRKSFRFNAGVAVGTMAELALSPNGTLATNRALIKDSNGNDSTITVLDDEILDVIVGVRIYLQETISGSFDLKDKNGNIIDTINYTGKPLVLGSITSKSFNLARLTVNYTNSSFRVWSGTLNSGHTTVPNGSSAAPSGTGASQSNTNPTARSLRAVQKFSVLNGNFNHRSCTCEIIGLSSGNIGYQIRFDKVIPKTSAETITYTMSLSWDRYVA